MSSNKEIYLDNAATTKTLPESARIACDIMTNEYGNPSSVHSKGFLAEQLLNSARSDIANVFGVKKTEIVFTNGGSEANNLAILGGVLAKKNRGKHIITTGIEHASVFKVIAYLRDEMGYELTYLPCDSKGRVSVNELSELLRDDTVLVSVMYVNNETGVIQPIDEISKVIKESGKSCLFHVDAIQAVGKIPLNIKHSRIDMLSASGHKFYGPKGVGFLYKRENIRLNPIIMGGGQESGLRSGTENVPGICAMSNSLKYVINKLSENGEKVKVLKEELIKGILGIENTFINGDLNDASPYILNASFRGVRAEVLIHALEEVGIYVSSVSACSSHSNKISHVLSEMGVDKDGMESAIRFSFCSDTTEDDIKECINALMELVPMLRKFKRM